jgi:hypothetical protein
METFHVTRKEMSQLLMSLSGQIDRVPKLILQEAWLKTRRDMVQSGKSLGAFISTAVPPIFDKVINMTPASDNGMSLNDIVSLGGQIEYNHFAVTAVQNWVKRDLREIIGTPKAGKKYSLEQAAVLFIIEDLRAALDLESIRKLLLQIFRNCDDDSDDLIRPTALYAGYSSIFEEMDLNNDQVLDLPGTGGGERKLDHLMEVMVKKKADEFTTRLTRLSPEEKEAVSNIIVIATLSVQTAYFQSLAKRFFHASMFLQNLE